MQGSVGVALLLVTAIYLGAALFRKKFLNFFFDQLKTVSERQAAAFAREQQREAGGYVQRLGQLVGLARDWAVLRGAGLPVPPLPGLRWRRGAGAGGDGGGSPASAPDGVPMPAPVQDAAAASGEGSAEGSRSGPTFVFVSLGGEREEGGGFQRRLAGARQGAFQGPVVDLGPDEYAVLAGDLAPARVDDQRTEPWGAAAAAFASEEERQAVSSAVAADAGDAGPRRLAAGVVDLSPEQYTVLAGDLAPDGGAAPAGEGIAPPPDGAPSSFDGAGRGRGARGPGGGTGPEGAAAFPDGGRPEPRVRPETSGPPPARGAAPGDAPSRSTAEIRRLSPGPVSPGRPAASVPDGAPALQPGGRGSAAEPAGSAAGNASVGRSPLAAGGPVPSGKEGAGRREAGDVHAESIRSGAQNGTRTRSLRGGGRPRAQALPRLAAGAPQEPVRPEGNGGEES